MDSKGKCCVGPLKDALGTCCAQDDVLDAKGEGAGARLPYRTL